MPRSPAHMLGWAAAVLAGCGGATPLAPPPLPESAPVATAAEPAPSALPALPFRLPCGAGDVVGCTNGCNDKVVEDCVTLGAMYLAGAVVTVDHERAVALFRGACGGDSARGCLLLAEAYHAGFVPPDGRDPHAEEVVFARRACDGGANQGCLVAGRDLATGHGGRQAPGEAVRLFSGICERGNAEACLELGKLAQQGEGVPRSPERALGLFRKACGLGLPEACLHVSPKGDQRSPRE